MHTIFDYNSKGAWTILNKVLNKSGLKHNVWIAKKAK